MGNSFGSKKKTVKVMKISGDTMKLKPPVLAADVLKDFPTFVLLESEAVKHYGVRAPPLEPNHKLCPRRLYFLVELPKKEHVPRRVRSAINMTAKDRLESLMLARRSASDLSAMKSAGVSPEEEEGGGRRLKVRLPRKEVERVMRESRDEREAAEKMVGIFMERRREGVCENAAETTKVDNGGRKVCEKRVSFMGVREAKVQIPVASY